MGGDSVTGGQRIGWSKREHKLTCGRKVVPARTNQGLSEEGKS